MKTIEGTRLRVADDIPQLVGETPILQLKKLVPADSAGVFVKLEYLNPGGSVKDRAAIGIIRRAEQEGKLRPAGTIVEATAGNTGIGLGAHRRQPRLQGGHSSSRKVSPKKKSSS